MGIEGGLRPSVGFTPTIKNRGTGYVHPQVEQAPTVKGLLPLPNQLSCFFHCPQFTPIRSGFNPTEDSSRCFKGSKNVPELWILYEFTEHSVLDS